ncbi:hypothetical protein B484DRAFT_479046 [Ochromonadaceae sp. CCMP2298]|nr:hypothetical protein B484DRAFT_479046 [Ochromonadaceae sp. CCMP2298]
MDKRGRGMDKRERGLETRETEQRGWAETVSAKFGGGSIISYSDVASMSASKDRNRASADSDRADAEQAADSERLELLAGREAQQMGAQAMGARHIRSTLRQALLRQKLSAFRQWGVAMQCMRDVENSREQARLLVYAKDQRSVREGELQISLDMEREKCQVLQAKLGSLMRALDGAEGRLAEAHVGSGLMGARERELEGLLAAEREKGFIAAARFNTVRVQREREVAALLEKVGGLEEGARGRAEAEARAEAGRALISTPSPTPTPSPVMQDSSVMTSIDMGQGGMGGMGRSQPPQKPPPPVHLRQSLQRHYLSDASENDLFEKVERKMAQRKTVGEIEAEAMASLAVEIHSRLASPPH